MTKATRLTDDLYDRIDAQAAQIERLREDNEALRRRLLRTVSVNGVPMFDYMQARDGTMLNVRDIVDAARGKE